jgi:proline iminopeptidase
VVRAADERHNHPVPITVLSGGLMRISLDDVRLWFDVSGPSVLPEGDTIAARPTIVAVHGGPRVDHINTKAKPAPLPEYV